MPTATLNINGDVGGITFSSALSRAAAGQIGHQTDLPAAKAGTLSTRTNNTDGTLTLGASHGILTADVIDLYWNGGRRYNVVVGTVSGTSVPISGGAGDNLPVQDTAITCQKQQIIDTDFLGDLLVAIAAQCGKRGRIQFYDTTNLRLGVDLAAGEVWQWIKDTGAVNPLATYTITQVKVTQADATVTASLKLGGLYTSI